MNNLCPCGLEKSYTECCGYYHSRKGIPPTAEILMRSRYCAFVLKKEKYLLQTWHKSKRPKTLDLNLQNIKWMGLKILQIEAGTEKDIAGKVEFIAEFKAGNKVSSLHEKSNFIKEASRWLYVDGEMISNF